MYNEYSLGLKSRIAEVSARFKSDNMKFSQRLDEIVTDKTEEMGISGIYMVILCIIVLAIFIYNINIYSGISMITLLLSLNATSQNNTYRSRACRSP